MLLLQYRAKYTVLFTARYSAVGYTRGYGKSPVRLSVFKLSVTLVYLDQVILNFFANNYTKISLRSSLPGDNEAPVCCNGTLTIIREYVFTFF